MIVKLFLIRTKCRRKTNKLKSLHELFSAAVFCLVSKSVFQ